MALTRSTFKGRGAGYTDKGVTMRCVKPDQSAITITLHYVTNGGVMLRFAVLKQEFLIPIVLILRALRETTDSELFDKLTMLDRDNTYLVTRVEMLLRESAEFASFSPAEALIYLGKCVLIPSLDMAPHAWFLAGARFRSVLRIIPTRSDEDVGRELVERYVCVHLASYADKQECLFHMTRKLYAFVQGKCRADNPDSFMNQELLLSGHLYTMFIKEKLEETLAGVVTQVQKDCRGQNGERILAACKTEQYWSQLLGRFGGTVGKKASYLLATGNLVSRSGLDLMQVSGYTVVAERLNFFRFLSHFQSVHRGQFFTQMKTTTVRKLLPESFGFLCPVHTPDGAPCGLLNHLATTARILTCPAPPSSWMALPSLLTSMGISPMVGSFLPSGYMQVLLDGKVIGGAPPEVCMRAEADLRVLKVVARGGGEAEVLDTLEIAYIPPTRGGPYPGLFLFTGPARTVRPVLYIATGAMEWIGPMEQVSSGS
jgi:DNA-directed RNA polymerase I subunit RPA2